MNIGCNIIIVEMHQAGFQVNGLLLRSRKLAEACGLLNNIPTDFYSLFLTYFLTHIENVKLFLQDFNSYEETKTFLPLANKFIADNYAVFNKKQFLNNLTDDKVFFNSFVNLYNSLTIIKMKIP